MCTTRDIKSAKAKPITRRRFEQRFCGALLLLIFATIVMVSVFLTHLFGRLVERLDGHVAIDSAKEAGEEKPRTLQRTAAAAWLNEHDFVFIRFMPRGVASFTFLKENDTDIRKTST
jgi:hypothetical protein